MDIDGFGIKLVDQLVDAKLVNNVADIFCLNLKQLSKLERMAEKSAQNIMDAIETSKFTTMARFIHGLGIRNVGTHASKVLEKSFSGSVKKLTNANMEQLTEIYEIGEIMAESICNFFQESNNRKVIQACLDAGVHFSEVEQIQESEYTGKTFVFTGSLEKFNRNDAQSMVEKLGARASSSVSSKTDYVIAGASSGSKLEYARNLGISILSEDEFLRMMEEK
jgi:DNA ligase (NAD+)